MVRPLGVGGAGSTNAAPFLVAGPGGLPTVATDGPGGALWLYWQAANAQWYGPLDPVNEQAVTVPAGAPYFTYSATLDEGGSGTGYSDYINAHDSDGNAISVGIQTDSTAPQSNGQPVYTWELVQNGQFTFGYLNPAQVGNDPVTLSWWSGPQVAVFYEGSTPIADISTNLVPRIGFSVEGDARQAGDSVNDVITNTQITVGNNCPSYCGLTSSWVPYSFYGLSATETNGAKENGANFTVTGTASGLPPGGNWGSNEIAGLSDISQYWNGQ